MSVAAAPARSRRRGALGWLALVAGILAVALVGGTLVYGGYTQRAALDPESAGADGTRAVVSLLEQQGVRVSIARDRGAAERALDGGEATLAMRDAPMLSDEGLRDLTDRARHVVLLEPRARTLDVLVNGSGLGGFADDRAVAAECPVPAAANAGSARIGQLMTPGEGVDGCFPVDGGFGLLTRETPTGSITALDARATLTNAVLPLDGDAALALAVLGETDTLVWYIPSLADADRAEAAPTLGELTPPWVTPGIVILIVAALVAALWRGRRFGPLVTERLPVTVRANETTEGRARLYATARDAPHALDELRRAARGRLERLLGLPARSDPGQTADAIAERLGAERGRVRAILLDDQPRTDRDLVAAADRLRDLEASVRAAVRSEGTLR